ncbi:helix-turn-helix domain-containing protein [Bradyrhizobium sp.]
MLRSPETVERVKELLAQGIEVAQIVQRLGISQTTVRRIRNLEKSNDRSGTTDGSVADGN